MPLAALATTSDLTARGITFTSPAEDTKVAKFLAEASAAVRDAAGVPISEVTSEVDVLGGTGQWLALPGPPVTEVSTVAVDGSAVSDHRLIQDRLWRRCGWQSTCDPSVVTVTMTHGFAEVPEDIIGMVCVLVAGALRASRSTSDGSSIAPPPSDVVALGIDDYRVQFTQDFEGRNLTLFDIPERVKESLRARFGGGVGVVRPA